MVLFVVVYLMVIGEFEVWLSCIGMFIVLFFLGIEYVEVVGEMVVLVNLLLMVNLYNE